MKKIIKVTNLTELKKLYDECAYVFEGCDHNNLEELVNTYGDGNDAIGYVFTAELLYEVCKLPDTFPLPKDREYLAIIPPKDAYKDTALQTITSKIWQISFVTGYNAFAKK